MARISDLVDAFLFWLLVLAVGFGFGFGAARIWVP